MYRENGTPYAACGLIWNRFGKYVLKFKDPSLSEDEINSIFKYIDRNLIEGIDAQDNGIRISDGEIPMMNIASIISGFNPTWDSDRNEDEAFNEAVESVSYILRNTIEHRISVLKARADVVKAYENRAIPQVLILDKYFPYGEALRDIDDNKEVFFVVYPRKDSYAIQTIRTTGGEDRKKFPKAWAGKRDEELAEVTGVSDAVFCHTGRFIAVANSFEGIMNLAKLAIDEPEEEVPRGLFGFIRNLFSKK